MWGRLKAACWVLHFFEGRREGGGGGNNLAGAPGHRGGRSTQIAIGVRAGARGGAQGDRRTYGR